MGEGNPKGLRKMNQEPPPKDIARELQQIKLLDFYMGLVGEHTEACLERATRCFALIYYTST